MSSPEPTTPLNRRRHALVLAALLLLLAAPLFFSSTPLDGLILCPLRATTGLECAGCGMTRSWVALTHGQITDSLIFHPLGLLLYLVAAAKALLVIFELRINRSLEWPWLARLRMPIVVIFTVGFVALGIVRASRFIAA